MKFLRIRDETSNFVDFFGKLKKNHILENHTYENNSHFNENNNHLWVCWYALITEDPVTVSEKWLNNGDLLTEYNLFNCLDVTI